jgi:hypothetical protein
MPFLDENLLERAAAKARQTRDDLLDSSFAQRASDLASRVTGTVVPVGIGSFVGGLASGAGQPIPFDLILGTAGVLVGLYTSPTRPRSDDGSLLGSRMLGAGLLASAAARYGAQFGGKT